MKENDYDKTSPAVKFLVTIAIIYLAWFMFTPVVRFSEQNDRIKKEIEKLRELQNNENR